jgi:hypothetical protein
VAKLYFLPAKSISETDESCEESGGVSGQVGEIERMSTLRRFLPPQVADLIAASGSERQLAE